MATLQIQNIYKQYGSSAVLQGLSFDVQPGEVYALLGQNGAGKTTTLHISLGLIGADRGAVRLLGEVVEPRQLASRRYPVAFIPEVVQLYPLFTAIEQVGYFTRLAGQHVKRAELVQWLRMAGLPEVDMDRRVGEFSKGMRQKVAIGIALARKAELIVLDEPTSGLDPRAIHEFGDLLHQLAQEGRAVLMTTHDIFHAAQVAHRIGILKEGRLVHEVTNEALSPEALQQLYLETV